MSVRPWESSGIPRPPPRFRSSSQEDEPSKPAHSRQPAAPSLAGIPRYPQPSSSSRSSAGSRTGSPRVTTVASSGAPAAGAASTTQGASPGSPQPQLSIMDLVNQAAKQDEIEAAVAAARKAARSQYRASAVAAGTAAGASSPTGANAAATAGKPPMSPHLKGRSSGNSSNASSQPSRSSSPRQAAAVTPVDPKVAGSPAAKEADIEPALRQQLQPGAVQQVSGSSSSPFSQASKPQLLVALLTSQVCGSSECCSEDGAAAPPSSSSSLSSSCSNSSLCSSASGLSNASTLSGGSRPKSILLNRTSSSSSGSAGSSPRFSKHVTWKDGSADEEAVGRDLVAVLLLEDTPEMRRVRKDTWPERPGARRDAADAAAAAAQAAAAAVTAAASAEASRKDQQQGKEKEGGTPRLVAKLLEPPARLLDWRDKLRLLQQEQRQQRMAQVHAGWEQQTKQPRHQRQRQQQQHGDLQQEQQQQPASMVAADCVKPSGCAAAGPICLNAVAAASLPQPAAC